MRLVAAVAAGLACWLWLRPVAALRLRHTHGGVSRPGGSWPRSLLPGAALACAGAVGLLAGGLAGAAVACAAALPLVTAAALWRRHRARAGATAAAVEVADACRLLAGLIRVGHTPAAALVAAARDAPVLVEAAAVETIGGDPTAVWVRQGSSPGRYGLVELATSWRVAERTGASLTATLDALVERLAARRKVTDVVAAELSAPRATGRLLAVLPLLGIALGYAFGGDPVAFLTGSPPGLASLVLGVALGCCGVLWTERIAAAGSG